MTCTIHDGRRQMDILGDFWQLYVVSREELSGATSRLATLFMAAEFSLSLQPGMEVTLSESAFATPEAKEPPSSGIQGFSEPRVLDLTMRPNGHRAAFSQGDMP
eukprot:6111888-Pyramimonas_sp.AAC.1